MKIVNARIVYSAAFSDNDTAMCNGWPFYWSALCCYVAYVVTRRGRTARNGAADKFISTSIVVDRRWWRQGGGEEYAPRART